MSTSAITHNSSGIYFREIDLTVVQQTAGVFAGACLGLMEKGPAFEIMTFSNFADRTVRMGNLNPDFPSSYYAAEFLNQANNYKEVRILGLEGYNEAPNFNQQGVNTGGINGGFAVMYSGIGHSSPAALPFDIVDVVTATDPSTNPPYTGLSTAKIVCSASPGLAVGDRVKISGVLGYTAANGEFTVGTITTTTVTNDSFFIYQDGLYTQAVTSTSPYILNTGIVKSTAPLSADMETIACILKPRRSGFMNINASVSYVKVSQILQRDGLTTDATDDLFEVTVYFTGDQTVYLPLVTKCSLRPSAREYIGKVFGTNPLDVTKIQGQVSPLWVEYIYPSQLQSRLDTNHLITTPSYYYPGDTVSHTLLSLVQGNITFNTDFEYPSHFITTAGIVNGLFQITTDKPHGYLALTSTTSNTIGLGSQTFTTNVYSSAFAVGSRVRVESSVTPTAYMEGVIVSFNSTTLVLIVNIDIINDSGSYTSWNITQVNSVNAGQEVTLTLNQGTTHLRKSDGSTLDGNWFIDSVLSPTVFTVVDAEGNTPAITGTWYSQGLSFERQTFTPTWEKDVLSLGGSGVEVPYQTPITPWFVSDFDTQGSYKRLFRLWSISDGESANTEIKVEISSIDPNGNNGSGSFSLYLRSFNDTEDTGKSIRETYANLTMDPTLDNYILRRIGDGDNFPLVSSYVFVELNTDDTFEPDDLPYGCEGFPGVTGLKVPDVVWSTNYNLAKPITKQILGLSNNNINTLADVTPDNFSFKNISDYNTAVGIGFHLNPNYLQGAGAVKPGWYDPTLYSLMSTKFQLVVPDAYFVSTSNTNFVTGSTKVNRTAFVSCFFGGFDGWDKYNSRTWNDTDSKDYEALTMGIVPLSDGESLFADFSVLVTPDIDFENDPNATEAVLEMVQNRGDALYVFDFSYYTGMIPDAVSAKNSLLNSNMLSSYSAVYYPDCQISDEINKINPWVNPSMIALATIASTATKENVWQPPAGCLRTVTDNIVRVRSRMKVDDRDILHSAMINPLTLFPGTGFEITQSNTTQSVLSALSWIHNRLLLGYAKKALNQTLRPLLHQLYGTTTFADAFVNAVTPIFDRIKRLNGLEQFEVVVVSSDNDRTTVNGQIIITPLYPVERIISDFLLTNTGITYSA